MNNENETLCEEVSFNKAYFKCASSYEFPTINGDRDAALDLVQDAFAKIWEHCSQIEFSKVKTYLFTTVNNLFLNTIKHQSGLAYAKETPNLDRTNQSPEYILEEEEFKIKLQAAIALSEAQREVFLMNRIDGKKYREIAELLDISQKQ
jgi:RNA polymerase sigma-70 factor (ECF subfamily)